MTDQQAAPLASWVGLKVDKGTWQAHGPQQVDVWDGWVGGWLFRWTDGR